MRMKLDRILEQHPLVAELDALRLRTFHDCFALSGWPRSKSQDVAL